MQYLKPLDGLRAISVLLVIMYHWHFSLANNFGWIGVQMFFVISGYLITTKLLVDKSKPLKDYLRNFYVKRFLRMFPVYYLYLFICILICALPILPAWLRENFSEIKTNGGLLFTYTYNYMYVVNHYLDKSLQWQGFYAHLWSISVEEQFYLFFPFVTFFFNRRWLTWALVAILIVTPVLRYLAYPLLATINPQTWWIGGVFYKSTFFQVDALAMGALLALISHWFNLKVSYILFAVSSVLLLMFGYYYGNGELRLIFSLGIYFPEQLKGHNYVLMYSLLNIWSAAIILVLINGGFTWLANNALVFIGKISYGIYLYHYGMISLLIILLKAYGHYDYFNKNIPAQLLLLALYLIVLLLVSHLSYTYFEKFFLNIKDRYLARK